jgi:tRNA pseudouridine38-40 synthase
VTEPSLRKLAVDRDRSRHVLLWIQFDGTDFAGFQRQAEGIRTVAGTLEAAWLRMLGEVAIARTSSRTDAGVHARRMPVLVRTDKSVPARGLMLGLNAHLPEDMAVIAADDVPAAFDVRADAVGKRYVYRVTVGEARWPLQRRHAWHVRGPLDLGAMQQGASHFAGIHDFSAFRAVGCTAASTVRHLRGVEVAQPEPHLLTVTVDGNAFLLNMVRIIAGTLVDVGRSRLDPLAIPQILASLDRTRAGQTAPSHGLTLDEVFYGPAGERQGVNYKDMLANMELARQG